MEIILELSLLYLQPININQLKLVSKNTYNYISKIKLEYNRKIYNKSICCNCDNYAISFNYCLKCLKKINLITQTDINKKYKIKNLEMFVPYYCTHKFYKKDMVLYKKEDIIEYILVNNNFKQIIINKKISNVKIKREEKINELYNNIRKDSELYQLCIQPYINNGKGGLKLIKLKINKFNSYNLIPYKIIDILKNIYGNNLLEEYIQDETKQLFHIYFISEISRCINLDSELQKYSLSIRSDSELCKNYIKYNTNQLEYVVYMTREINYFYNETDYKKRMKKLNNIYYYDYLDLSLECKKEIIKSNKYTIPNFIKEYYSIKDS